MNEYFKVVSPLRTSIFTSQGGLTPYEENPFILFYEEGRTIESCPGAIGICVSKTIDEAILYQKSLRYRSMIIRVYSESNETIPAKMSKRGGLKHLMYFYMNNDDSDRIDNKYIWVDKVLVSKDAPFSFLDLFGTKSWEYK